MLIIFKAERLTRQQPGLPLNLHNTLNFKTHSIAENAKALAGCCSTMLGDSGIPLTSHFLYVQYAVQEV